MSIWNRNTSKQPELSIKLNVDTPPLYVLTDDDSNNETYYVYYKRYFYSAGAPACTEGYEKLEICFSSIEEAREWVINQCLNTSRTIENCRIVCEYSI